MQIIEGAGFRLMTDDPVVIAVVRKCAELEKQNKRLRENHVYDFRSVRSEIRRLRKIAERKS